MLGGSESCRSNLLAALIYFGLVLSLSNWSHNILWFMSPTTCWASTGHLNREGCGWRRKKDMHLSRTETGASCTSAVSQFLLQRERGRENLRLTHLLHYVWRKDSWGEGPTEDVRELFVQASDPHALKVPVGVDDGLPRASGLWFSWGRMIKIRLLRNTKEIQENILFIFHSPRSNPVSN